MGIVDKAIDLIPIAQDDVQAIVALPSVVIAHVVVCMTATGDGLTQLGNGVARLQGSLDQPTAFVV